MLTVALTNHSTCNDNLGVGALTVSEVEILRSCARAIGTELRIVVIDGRGDRPPYISGPDIDIRFVREFRQLRRIYSIFREADIVVDIGGGDSFADIYGARRLARMLLVKYAVLMARRPLVLAPQTMGPFANPWWRRVAAPTIDRAAIVATRDRMSTDYLRASGYRGEIVEASDVALRLPYDLPARQPSGPVRVGLNISGLLANGGYTGDNMFGLAFDYREVMADVIRDFLNGSEEVEVHLVPHVISSRRGSVEDDHQASLDLAAEIGSDRVEVAPAFAGPSDAKSYIAGLDFFAGARMHACIAAFSSGVPVVPLAYSRKFAGLFGSLGYDRTVDCTGESAESLRRKLQDGFERRAALAGEVRAASALGLERLAAYEAALSRLMEDVLTRRE